MLQSYKAAMTRSKKQGKEVANQSLYCTVLRYYHCVHDDEGVNRRGI